MLASEVSEATMAKLRAIGEQKEYDILRFFTHLDGHPIYELDWSTRKPHSKTGLPLLYAVDDNGEIYRLDYDDVFAAMGTLHLSEDGTHYVGADK